MLETGADAAPRPTPTPKPVQCPGSQHWDGTKCACASGEICGPACCLIGSECCDGACCFGHCYGEELCCAYDNWCDATGECCPVGTTCCGELGCIPGDTCGCLAGCPDGFECCGGECCASGYCANEWCCALGTCAGACLTGENEGCCAGSVYDKTTHVCCDEELISGNCCDTSECTASCGGACEKVGSRQVCTYLRC